MARSRFACWLLSFETCAERLVGRCTIRTAVSRLFTFFPPAPPDLANWISRSSSLISTSASFSMSGNTSTSANDVCRLSCALNGEIRTSRCTPASCFKCPYTFFPHTSNTTLRYPPCEFSLSSRNRTSQFFCAAYPWYMSNNMATKSSASCPPAPASIVTTAPPTSYLLPPSATAARAFASWISACAFAESCQKSGWSIAASISCIRSFASSLVTKSG